jgi:hypothetical protein
MVVTKIDSASSCIVISVPNIPDILNNDFLNHHLFARPRRQPSSMRAAKMGRYCLKRRASPRASAEKRKT